MPSLDGAGLDLLFRGARTHRDWRPGAVDAATLKAVYELARMPPTSANSQPMRIAFVVSAEAKERLKPCLDKGNVEQTMQAPATAIVAYDRQFHAFMPKLRPGSRAGQRFAGDPEGAEAVARLSGTLQGGYFILAARALGLDVGPMGGFDAAKVEQAFFPDGRWRALFLCNLGRGDPAALGPRAPRLDFEEACTVL